jgi:hypothetical protein
MASIAVNNPNNLTLPESRIPSVSLEAYNKLKSKYENKQKENKILKENLDSIMNSYEVISESKKTVESIFDTIKILIKTNKNFFNKSKEEFSTSNSHYEYVATADMKTSARSSCNCSSSTLNLKEFQYFNPSPSVLKKIEEMENAYHEILKNFNFLTAKYKVIKEEKDKTEEQNETLIEQITGLTEEYNRICSELSEANVTIERFKEIDKCLVDATINTLFLNTNEKRPLNNKNDDNNNNDNNNKKFSGYVLCEPVPSFIKFINKFTK